MAAEHLFLNHTVVSPAIPLVRDEMLCLADLSE